MCFIAFFLLPETQGKTLTELATIYEKKKPKMYQPKVEPPWDLPIPKEHEAYGNTGYGVSSLGRQNWKGFCLKINIVYSRAEARVTIQEIRIFF